jgi:nucleotide-binding universal stress UspA family protein
MPPSGSSKKPSVIVGYDGREPADDALVLGAGLAAALRCELVVACAVSYEPSRLDVGDYNRSRARFLDEAFQRAETLLGSSGFRRVELQDTPAHGLHRLAEEPDATLVVVGSSHRGVAGRIFPGSVGERLLHGSPCPVALAPNGYAQRGVDVQSIAVGVDGRAAAELALGFATRLARCFAARLALIRVGPDVRWGMVEVPPLELINEANRKSLQRALDRLPDDVRAEAHYYEGEPASELILHAGDHDLLVLGSRGYGPVRSVLLGGVSTVVVRHVGVPVIVVPRGAEKRGDIGDELLGTATV